MGSVQVLLGVAALSASGMQSVYSPVPLPCYKCTRLCRSGKQPIVGNTATTQYLITKRR